MFTRTTTEVIAQLGLIAALGYCWVGLVPPTGSALDYVLNPAYFALVAATISSVTYLSVSALVTNSLDLRRLFLALFLAGMPLIYLWAAILASNHQGIIREAVGAAIFIPMAVLGCRRSLLLLGAGIAAHGIAWDIWHHHHAPYIEPWYPAGCLIIDLALFFVVAAQHFGGRAMGDESTLASTTEQSVGN